MPWSPAFAQNIRTSVSPRLVTAPFEIDESYAAAGYVVSRAGENFAIRE
jgi:hypothetical protein